MPSNSKATFDITTLAQAWKNGTCNINAGFVLTCDVQVDKAIYSSEYSSTTYRPYVVATYTDPAPEPEPEPETVTITLSTTHLTINVNQMATLTATASNGQAVTWTPADTSIAAISSSGNEGRVYNFACYYAFSEMGNIENLKNTQ